jgi:Zn-dependent protease
MIAQKFPVYLPYANLPPMDWVKVFREMLLAYIFFIPLLTFHEWAHAWTAWKCGDDTAKKLGRVSLNPIVHMDLIGTVILPLVGMISSALGAGIIIGWGKPVPVDPNNLKHPRAQDTLIAMAGPAMNILLAFLLLILVKILGTGTVADVAAKMASLSLLLCFFNLIPIPPLDGSHLIMNLVGLSYKYFIRVSIAGFIAIIILIQFPWMQKGLEAVVSGTYKIMARLLGLPLP